MGLLLKTDIFHVILDLKTTIYKTIIILVCSGIKFLDLNISLLRKIKFCISSAYKGNLGPKTFLHNVLKNKHKGQKRNKINSSFHFFFQPREKIF